MKSNELSFQMSAQELVDPRTAVTDAIEFEDLDAVWNPVAPSANEAAPAAFASSDDAEFELELEAEAIDALLSTSALIKR